MRAAVYLRISQDQTGKQLGVTRQLEDCTDLAERLEWDVAEVYTDNDISAYKHRPAYRKMLADIEAGEIQALVAWHPDRLYRRAVDLADLVDVCKKNNVQVATVTAGNVDLSTPAGRMIAGMLAQVATYEGEQKAERWKRSVRQRREKGDMPGHRSRMFGWTRAGEVIDDEAKVVRWMAEEITAGASATSVVRKLERQGVKTTHGNVWTIQSLKRYLTNPRVAGHSKLNGDIVGVGQWPPLLDPETWETVRALLTSRRRRPPPRIALLAGLIYCDCGTKMVTGARMKKDGTTQRVYRCNRNPGVNGCGKISARADVVEEIVEAYARKRLDNPAVRRHLARLAAPSPAGAVAAEIASLDERIAELEASLDEPGVPVTAILNAIDRARERMVTLQASIVPTAEPIPAKGTPWPEDLQRRRRLVALVVDRIEITPATRSGVFDPERVKIKRR